MRSLAFTQTGAEYWNQFASLCCSCGLCTLYACPEELFPKEACDASKAEMRKANVKWTGPMTVQPHPMRDGRRVPIKSLMKKMHILQYDHPAHLENLTVNPRRLIVPLKQNAGAANLPLVKAGERVRAGQLLGQVPEKALGAPIHASLDATVEAVNAQHIILTRQA
jgi:Na+-translocating ferredoxin:NAD+ oxidoreductase RnfC subunit